MEKFSLISNIVTDISRHEGKEKKLRLGMIDISPGYYLKKELMKYGIEKLEDIAQTYEPYLKSHDVKILSAAIYMDQIVKTMRIKLSSEQLKEYGMSSKEIAEYKKLPQKPRREIKEALDYCISIILEDISDDKAKEIDRNSLIVGIYSYYNYIKA